MNKLGNVVEKFTRCENIQKFNTRTKPVSVRHDLARRYGCTSDMMHGGGLSKQTRLPLLNLVEEKML